MRVSGAQQSSRATPRFFYGYAIVTAALFIGVAAIGTHQMFGVFFKPLLAEFGWTRATLSGALSICLIVSGVVAIAMGAFNDRVGPRIVLTICGFFLGIGYFLMSRMTTVWEVYLYFGVIIGIGMSGHWVPTTSTVARWFTRRRGMMTGIMVTSCGIGPLIGPLVADRLISVYDWRTSYLIIAAAVFVVYVLAAQFMKRDPAKMGLTADNERQPERQGTDSDKDGFSFNEAVRTRQFWLVFGMLFCSGFGYFTLITHIVPHATDLGISTTTAAGVLAASGVLTIIGNIVTGSIADRIGNKQIFIICFTLVAISYFWLVATKEVWGLYLFAVLFGFAVGGNTTAQSPLVAWLFGLRQHGLIFGVVVLGLTTGGSIGPFVTGYIYDITNTYQMDFIMLGIFSVIGLVLTLVLHPVKNINQRRLSDVRIDSQIQAG